LHKLVGKNAYLMATKGILHRSKGHPAAFTVPKGTGKTAVATAPKPTAAMAASRPNAVTQTPLKQLLERFLQKSAQPMTGSELAKEALQAGYRTTSKHFVDSVWTALGNMKNVENVKGRGYRLKRRKS